MLVRCYSMNRIAALRKENKMSQRELAARLGVGDATVTKYESEDIRLTEDKLRMLSIIFDVSTDYILGLSDERKRGTTYATPLIASLLSKAGSLSEDDRKILVDCAVDTESLKFIREFQSLSKKSKRKAVDYLDLLKLDEAHRSGKGAEERPEGAAGGNDDTKQGK